METSPRRTRQRTRQEKLALGICPLALTNTSIIGSHSIGAGQGTPFAVPNIYSPSIIHVPTPLTAKQSGLSLADLRILHRKQNWLRTHIINIPLHKYAPSVIHAVEATLVFAQEEGGTAVCISQDGLLLTCSHCVAETEEEFTSSKVKWLLFASGQVVKAECVSWDPKRDLALLRIVAGQRHHQSSTAIGFSTQHSFTFPSITLSPTSPLTKTLLLCIGHPGSEDLECDTPGHKTNYDVLHVSKGAFHGYAVNQDPHDNSEIGALMHDCWTYWGHSGAPLVERDTGNLVGLHSSWDDQTGMRRGVGWDALGAFLQEGKVIPL
ncbi:trypsin-like cysteine/serine peptidase domain-containing protein [Terfezia claveryi]|nr:trypsin-like cysteine/serine peptidase domain-containing protein [Terfezia claveryi]